ncbi:MAG: HAD hydrolase family protein [Balneolaceae bacterium]
MIKLFVTDLDGCISHPFKTPEWNAINRLRELNILSRNDNKIPPLSICTGRPFPYAEAVAQWLDVRIPFVFESAGLLHLEGQRIETAVNHHNGDLEPIYKMQKWLQEEILPNYPDTVVEFTKMMDAGVVSPDVDVINKIHKIILDKIERDQLDLEVHTTDVSVNVLMSGNNKLRGLELLGKSLDIRLDEMAYIGDSGGDVVALKNVKRPFSPSNARQEAKDHSEVLDEEATNAVLKAYELVIEYNRKYQG